ncbi:MAG: penicillin acylase family protein [Myxococcales bacterium]|nr:penicillin acylase family protein [Myxococcales bacterium]
MRHPVLIGLAVAALALIGCDDDTDANPPADAAPADAAAPPADAAPADAAPDATPLLDRYDSLRAPVEIRVDPHGIAHIYAQDDLDLFFAAGYRQAQDRLFAIDMGRRAATGRAAEVLGEGRLTGDIAARTLGFARLGEETLRLVGERRPDDHALVVAFAGGVNRRIAEIAAGDAPAPPEYATYGFTPEPVTPAELLAIGQRITFGFSSTLEYELLYSVLRRLAPGAAELPVFMPVGDAFIMGDAPPEPRSNIPLAAPRHIDPADARRLTDGLRELRRVFDMGDGSNCWVIGGAHTHNGRPIFANDSHATLLDPGIMWPVHLNSADAGGRWDAIGTAFTGVPGVQVGHNRDLVWGATTHFGDMLDLWDVDVDATGALIGDTRVPLDSHPETIRVRREDGTVDERTLTVRRVPGHGVIVPPEMLAGIPLGLVVDGELMLGWPGFEASTELFAYLDMARAPDLDAWVAAVRQQETGMQNWMAASRDGMRYQTSGRIPDRGPLGARAPANQVMDAADPTTLWTRGELPRDLLPASNGDVPYLYSANNDPWGHTADNDPLDDAFYYGSFYAPGFRAARLKALLPEVIADGPVDRARVEAMQTETWSLWADRVMPLLAEAVAAIDTDEDLAEFDREDLRAAADRLLTWDRHMTRDSQVAALWRIFAEYQNRGVVADDLGLIYPAIADAQPVYVAKFSLLALELQIESLLDASRARVLLTALDRALTVHLSRGEPTWGDLHRAELTAPDGTTRTLSTPGDDSALNVAQSRCGDGDEIAEHCVTTAGAVYRMVTTIEDDGIPQMSFACPACRPGGDDDWVEGRYVTLPFRRADVEAATVETISLR